MGLTVALAQIDVEFANPGVNFEKVSQFVAAAAKEHADVVVLPEMWNTGYALDQLAELADPDGQNTQDLLRELARDYRVNIVGGSVATKRDERFYNTSYIVDNQGRLISQYDKVHLFGLMNEGRYITAGKAENSFQLAGAPSAGVICYDIRFPEWLRTNARYGANVLYVSAEWPRPRITQWEILLRARAIENQAFVVAVNRVGDDPDNHFNGHSLVIDPLGNVLANAGETESLKLATIDFSQLDAVRGQIPVFKDRRPELYR